MRALTLNSYAFTMHFYLFLSLVHCQMAGPMQIYTFLCTVCCHSHWRAFHRPTIDPSTKAMRLPHMKCSRKGKYGFRAEFPLTSSVSALVGSYEIRADSG